MKALNFFIILSAFAILSYGQSKNSVSRDYTEKLRIVEKNGLYGLVDNNGNEIVKPVYNEIEPFGVYKKEWALVEKDGLYGFIDSEENEIVKPKYEEIFSEGSGIEGIINGNEEKINN